MAAITIGGREIPLFYSTCETVDIQKALGCTAFQLKEEVFGLEQADEDDPESLRMTVATDPVKMGKLGTLIRILGNAGLEEAGEEGDLTDKWVLRHMRPAQVTECALQALTTIVEGNRIEGPEPENAGPVDVNVERRNAKKPNGN